MKARFCGGGFALAWVAFAACAEEAWHGFPVYPPEATGALGPEGGRTAVRGREEMLQAIRSGPRQELAPGLSVPARSVTSTLGAEFDAAEEYLRREPPRRGWVPLFENSYRDGGSLGWVFGRLDERLRLVTVTLWSMGKMIPSHGFGGEMGEDWGHLDYRHEEREAPLRVEGFPACPRVRDRAAFTEERVPDGLRLTTAAAVCRDPGTDGRLARLPLLAGFEAHASELLGPRQLWTKGRTMVLVEPQPGDKVSFTFVEPARQAAVLETYPERVVREVSARSSCMILRGRYVRPPVALRLDSGMLTVNGEPVDVPDALSGGRRAPGNTLQELESRQRDLERSLPVVKSSGGEGSGGDLGSLGGCRGWLEAIDRAVRSPGTREERLEALRALPLLQGSSEESLSEILGRWDGID